MTTELVRGFKERTVSLFPPSEAVIVPPASVVASTMSISAEQVLRLGAFEMNYQLRSGHSATVLNITPVTSLVFQLTQEAVLASSQTTVPGSIAITKLADGVGSSASSSFVTPSITRPANSLLVMLVVGDRRVSSAFLQVTGISGAGITSFTEHLSVSFGSSAVMEMYRAQTSVAGSGALTVNLSTPGSPIEYSLVSIEGVSTGGVNGADAIVQSTYAATSDTNTTFISLAPAAATRNRMLGALFLNTAAGGITTGSGMTQLSLVTSGSYHLQTEWGASTSTQVGWSWSTVSGGGMFGFEVG